MSEQTTSVSSTYPADPIYMDYSATTPLRQEALDAMLPFFTEHFGNPSALYSLAQDSHNAVAESREAVGRVFGCRPSEVVFTGCGTESDNAAIKGAARAQIQHGKHIITTSIEHHAVIHSCDQLADDGFEITTLQVDSAGLVAPDDLRSAIRPDTTTVSIMYANNEIGVVQDIASLTEIAREAAGIHGHPIVFHTDAVQAAGWEPLDVDLLGVDLLSLSGHKFHGPKGVGILYVRRGTPLIPLLAGGGQESDRRSGTENVPGIVGIATALDLAESEREGLVQMIRPLRDYLIEGILERIDGAHLNGHRTRRLPNNVNVSFEGIEGEPLLISLDQAGIYASSASACSSASVEPSHVLLALGAESESAMGSLRLSLGRGNSKEDVDYVLDVLPRVVAELRAMPTLAST